MLTVLKIKNINPLLNAEIKNTADDKVDKVFKELAAPDGVNLFDYSYQINEEDQIINPLDPESFFVASAYKEA